MNKKIPDNAKRVFKGDIFSVWQWDQEMFDGTFKTYESISRNNSTSVLAVKKDKKILINYEEQPLLGNFISLPGGMGEDGLTELDNAKKELREETGYESAEWELWKVDDVLAHNKIEWNIVTFIARNCEKVTDTKFDPGEKIESVAMDFEEFLKVTQEDRFRSKSLKKFVFELMQDEKKKEEFKNFLLK